MSLIPVDDDGIQNGVEQVDGIRDISDNRGGPNPDAPFFRFNRQSGTWVFNLRTEDLDGFGKFILRIHIGDPAHAGSPDATDSTLVDGQDHRTGFELR